MTTPIETQTVAATAYGVPYSSKAALTITARTSVAIRESLDGRRRGLRAFLPIAGPAMVVSVAYMDPGNFAVNIQAGSSYGYGLLWVVLLANVIGMLFQSMSAKIGIVTGRNLAELCRDQFPRPVVLIMWIASEIAAMATDLAEFLGGAVRLALLFQMPLLYGMAVTAIVTYAVLFYGDSGFRRVEYIVGGLVGAIGLCYIIELFIVPPDWGKALYHSFVPELGGASAVTLAVGILGCTVMPHAIYLHSGLTQARVVLRDDADRRRLIKFSHREVVLALTFAGFINMAMVMMATTAFHEGGHSDVAEIETAYRTLLPLFGGATAAIFLIALMASGLSSSVAGTMAGQMIMQGFIRFRIPVWVRRLITMAPAFFVVAQGYNVTKSLVTSQVVLSIVLPIPMIALVILSSRRAVMGNFSSNPSTTVAALIGTAVVVILNVALVFQSLGLPIPLLRN